jgi:hypothetical protein
MAFRFRRSGLRGHLRGRFEPPEGPCERITRVCRRSLLRKSFSILWVADQLPFGHHPGQSAKAEAPDPARLLDLANHRLHDPVCAPGTAPCPTRCQAFPHRPRLRSAGPSTVTPASPFRASHPASPAHQCPPDSYLLTPLIPVTSVSGSYFRGCVQVTLNATDHGKQLVPVRHLLRYLRGHDDLGGTVDG